jgi:Kef-type K+ transport system membrane component KefB
VIAAAVIDDVLSLVLLAILTAVISSDQALSLQLLGMVALKLILFFGVAVLLSRYLLPRARLVLKRLKSEHSELSLLIIFGLALSVLAETLEMHFLIGAFTAGVLFTRNIVGKEVHERLANQTEAITLGFLAPVFFASIGIHLNLQALLNAPLFLLVLLLAATAGKLLGSGIAARLAGMSGRESFAVGAAMNARGAVEIIIADLALRAGLFDKPQPTPPAIDYLFSAIVIMAIVTTLSSPVALRRLLANRE